MTITQKKRLLKVKSDIESMFEGNLARFKFTPYMVELVLDVYGNLVNEQTAETICTEVKDFFAKRNFPVKEKGTGWEISL